MTSGVDRAPEVPGRSAPTGGGPDGSAPPRAMIAFGVAVALLSSGAFLGTFLGAGEGPSEPGQIVLALWSLAYVVAAGSLLDGLLRHRRAVHLSAPLVAFGVLAVLSTGWSYAPEVTLRRALALVGTVVVGLALAQKLRPVDLLAVVEKAVLIIAVASVAFFVTGDPRAVDPVHDTLQGVMPSKNTLGRAMGLGILAAAALAALEPHRRRRRLGSAASMAIPLAMAGSAGGLLLAIGIALVAVISMVWASARARAALASLGALLLGVLMVVLPGMTVEDVAGAVGRDPTLTGRTDLWRHAIDALGDAPLLGHGFGAFWHEDGPVTAERIAAREQWSVPHAHNGLLDVSLDLGVVGAALAAAVLIALAARGLGDAVAGRRARAVARLSFGAIILVSNVAESSLLRENALFTVILVAALCLPAPPARRVRLDGPRSAVPA